MSRELILAILTIIIGFSLSFSGLYYFSRKLEKQMVGIAARNWAFISLNLSNILIVACLFLFSELENDSIYAIRAAETFIPLILGIFCCIIGSFKRTQKYLNIALIGAVSISTFLLPSDFLICKGFLPFWADRLLIIVCWSYLACFYNIFNSLDGLLSSFSLPFYITPIILAILDAAPMFYGLVALSFLIGNFCLMIFGWAPSKIIFGSTVGKTIGYNIGWLITFSSTENLIPCYIILLLPFLLESLKAIFKKLLLRDRFDKLSQNTSFYQAHISGLPENQVCLAIIRIEIILVIVSCFQAFVGNTFSLPIVSLFLSIWFLEKLKNWNVPTQSLKEINQEFMDNLHQNINEIKEKMDRD